MTINTRQLAHMDLNLLVVFHVIFECRHVTQAATQLGLSQPAVSHALARLREMLGNPLFVKTPKGMLPTQRAMELAPKIKDLLERVDLGLMQGKSWDLSTAKRSFRIQSTDLIEQLLLPELIPILSKSARQSSVSFTTTQFALPKEALESGSTDLAIAGFFGELPPGFYRQKVFSDELKAAVRAGHPRLGKKTKLSVDELCAEAHILIAPGGELSGQLDRELEKIAKTRHVVAGLSSFMASGGILASTDAILIGPAKMLASYSSHLKLKTFALPIPLRPLHIVQVWHERNHHDFHHQWLREQIKTILAREMPNSKAGVKK